MICFVPVLWLTASTYPNDMFGYELWSNNRFRTVPYILVTSLWEYNTKTYHNTVNGCPGMMYEDLLFVPPFALYASEAQAREALGRFAPLRTNKSMPHAAQ